MLAGCHIYSLFIGCLSVALLSFCATSSWNWFTTNSNWNPRSGTDGCFWKTYRHQSSTDENSVIESNAILPPNAQDFRHYGCHRWLRKRFVLKQALYNYIMRRWSFCEGRRDWEPIIKYVQSLRRMLTPLTDTLFKFVSRNSQEI